MDNCIAMCIGFLHGQSKMSKDTFNDDWPLGPIIRLIFQPLIAVFSDHCTSRLGCRRPFIILFH